MLRMALGAAMAASLLAGCSPVPQFKSDHRIKPEQVAERVQCELQDVFRKTKNDHLAVQTFNIAFSLTLNVETTAAPNFSADWVIPYHLADTWTAKPSAGVTDNVLRESIVNYTLTMADLMAFTCPKALADAYRNDRQEAYIKYGDFGLDNWIDGLSRESKSRGQAKIGELKYTLKFILTLTGDPSPGFKIVNLSGTLKLPYTRKDTHSLIVILSPPKDGAPKALSGTTIDSLNQQLNLMQLRDVLRDR